MKYVKEEWRFAVVVVLLLGLIANVNERFQAVERELATQAEMQKIMHKYQIQTREQVLTCPKPKKR